jgi:hypothetical protein
VEVLVALQYPDLDGTTRQYMLEELELDVKQDRLYVSPRLSGTGIADYPAVLKSAIESGDDASLAVELRKNGRLNATEQRRKPKGGYTTAAVPVTAADTLAEGEFNRFYARADYVGGQKSRVAVNSKYTGPKKWRILVPSRKP